MAEGKLNTSIQRKVESAEPTGMLSAKSIMGNNPGVPDKKSTMDINGLSPKKLELPKRKKISKTVFKTPEAPIGRVPTSPIEEMLGNSVGANVAGYMRMK
jgi:hypothetical protein